jgi:phospholipase/carboxylesterase
MVRNRASGVGQSPAERGRLLARPSAPTAAAPAGLLSLGLDGSRDGLLYVPPGYQPDRPAPLALMLHGAGGDAQGGLFALRDLADEAGLLLLAPESRRQTWDVILGQYGPDVEFLDRALAQTFGRYAVDPAHLAVGGFSDGASYALSLGLTNGDLFTHVLAFSPGFMAPGGQQGAPRVFISHGTQDEVLPIDVCSRRIVPRLERAGYDVRYLEFDGPHTVPPAISREALAWYTQEA